MSQSCRASCSVTSPLVTTSGNGLRGVGSGFVFFLTRIWIFLASNSTRLRLRLLPSAPVIAPARAGSFSSSSLEPSSRLSPRPSSLCNPPSAASPAPPPDPPPFRCRPAIAAAWSAACARVSSAWMGAVMESCGRAASEATLDEREDRSLGDPGVDDAGMIPYVPNRWFGGANPGNFGNSRRVAAGLPA